MALTQKEIDAWKVQRWRARTDLEWLCREVLGYTDVKREVHPFLDRLQKFPRPNRAQFAANDIFDGRWMYTPLVPLYSLPSEKRRLLILDPRGHLKTTINVAAHTIQWIINYPDIAMLVVQATNGKAEDFLFEVKRHFQANPRFRALFPEHCPQKKVLDWGTRAQFTSEARGRGVIRKEATVMTASIDKGTAGYHYDVMKFSDVVEENNSKSVEQNRSIIRSFAMMENLLVRFDGWIDVEGTRYHEEDLYGTIIVEEAKRPPEKKQWTIHARGCYKKRTPDGRPQQFTPDELDLPYLLDETKPAPKDPEKEPDLRRQPWWPERFPVEALEAKRLDPLRSENFPAQQLNCPSEYLFSPFPWDEKLNYPRFIPQKYFLQHVRITSYEMSIDTSETAGPRSNATAAFVVGWGEDGLPYVVTMIREKMNPDQVIDLVFRLNEAWAPDKVKIEDVSFNRGLMTGFRREQDTHPDQPKYWIPWELLKRDNTQRKQERILNTLQPWYRHKDIIFVDMCSCRTTEDGPRGGTCTFCQTLTWLKREMTGFGVTEHDDMLDALSDIFQGRDWFGRTAQREGVKGRIPLLSRRQQYIQDAWERLTGQEPLDKIYADVAPPGVFPGPYDSFYVNRTGF